MNLRNVINGILVFFGEKGLHVAIIVGNKNGMMVSSAAPTPWVAKASQALARHTEDLEKVTSPDISKLMIDLDNEEPHALN